MVKIKFNKNYNNKLNCDIFTTIRRLNQKYLGIQKGTKVLIEGPDISFEGEVVSTTSYTTLYSIPSTVAFLDTGTSDWSELRSIFSKIYGEEAFADQYVLLTIKKIRKS